MSIYRLVGAAAAVAVIFAVTPALAQQVISEPGYCAFFYPNANCQNKGPGNPYTDARRPDQGYGVPGSAPTAGAVPRKRAHRSLTSMQ